MAKTLLCLFGELFMLASVSGLLDKMDLTSLQNEVTALKVQVSTLSGQMTTLQQTINATQSQLNASSALPVKTAALSVAFTSQLSKPVTNLGLHQHVVFDYVLSNVGNAYSNTQGHFTAPVNGVYTFFLTAMNMPGHSASLYLMVNGAEKALTLAHATTAWQFVSSTCFAVVVLKAGDEVWIQNEGQYSPVEELDGYGYSSFGGFLINEL